MIDDGALQHPAPTRSLSMHVWSTLPTGTVAITPGPVLAAIDKYDIVIAGSGAHGASPHHGVDPIVAAAAVINALASVQSRNRDPLEPAVVSIGTAHGGSAPNIIPESVAISGTLRAFDDTVMNMLRQRVREIAKQTAVAHGARAEVSFVETGVPPVVNDRALAVRVGDVARGLFGASRVRTDFKLAVSEDCALFLRAAPGVFALVGAGNSAAGIDAPHHSPRFQIDEGSLTDGAALMFASALELLNDAQ
jgi:amidohydrolase